MGLFVSAGYDLADVGSYELAVVETGGNTFNVEKTSGKYFLGTNAASASGDYASLVTGFGSLLADIETALNAGTGGGAYTVSQSSTTGLVTIAHNGVGGVSAVSLTATARGALIGQTATKSGALSHTMDRVPDYWLSGAIGFWSAYREYEDPDGVARDVIAHSGKPHGIARRIVPTLIDLEVPSEPIEAIYTSRAPAGAWTWQALFRHVRNTLPLAVDDGTFIHYTRLTEKGAVFSPIPRARDYLGHLDIPLRMRLLAREAA